MKTPPKKYLLLLSGVIVCFASLIGFTAIRQDSKVKHHPINPVTDKLPPVISKVRNIEVVRATIESQGTPGASAVLELRNNSDVGITAVTVTFDEASVGTGSATADPRVVIKPHETTTITISLRSLEDGVPLIVAGALYADGTEDGQDIVLEMMHDMRAREKAKHDEQKGAPKR